MWQSEAMKPDWQEADGKLERVDTLGWRGSKSEDSWRRVNRWRQSQSRDVASSQLAVSSAWLGQPPERLLLAHVPSLLSFPLRVQHSRVG